MPLDVPTEHQHVQSMAFCLDEDLEAAGETFVEELIRAVREG
jgi:hypothetical protein